MDDVGADLSFPVVPVDVAAREIVVGRNWCNLPMLTPVSVLGIANLLMHLEAGGVAVPSGPERRLGLAAVIVLIPLMAGHSWIDRRRCAAQCSHPRPGCGGDRHDDTGSDDASPPWPRRRQAFSRSRYGSDLHPCDPRGNHSWCRRVCHEPDNATSHRFNLSLDLRFCSLRACQWADAYPAAAPPVSRRCKWLSRTRGSISCRRENMLLARIDDAIRKPTSLPNPLAKV